MVFLGFTIQESCWKKRACHKKGIDTHVKSSLGSGLNIAFDRIETSSSQTTQDLLLAMWLKALRKRHADRKCGWLWFELLLAMGSMWEYDCKWICIHVLCNVLPYTHIPTVCTEILHWCSVNRASNETIYSNMKALYVVVQQLCSISTNLYVMRQQKISTSFPAV